MNRVNKNEKDVKYILDNLREVDHIECIDSKGENYKEIVYKEIMETDFDCLIGEDSGKPVVMGGVWRTNPDIPDCGCVWLLSTDEVVKHQVSLLRHLKHEFERYDEEFYITCNYIHDSNLVARRWLEWIGFDFNGLTGVPKKKNFTFFYRINPKMKKMKGLSSLTEEIKLSQKKKGI